MPLDTSRANDTAEWLINHGKIPGWEAYRVLRREVTMGDSRFDLLLGNKAVQFPVEVKSCTLFGKNGAMFPDAVTARGRKHVLHLGDIGKTAAGQACSFWFSGIVPGGFCLIIIQTPNSQRPFARSRRILTGRRRLCSGHRILPYRPACGFFRRRWKFWIRNRETGATICSCCIWTLRRI